MPKQGELLVSKDKQSGMWLVNISAKLSPTGSRVRKKFKTKAKAESYRKNLASTLQSDHLVEFDEVLLKNAHYYEQAFQVYGYGGLAEACAEWLTELERRRSTVTLGELLKQYKTTRGEDWSKGYLDTYNWVKKHLNPLSDQIINVLDAHHWQSWLPRWKKESAQSNLDRANKERANLKFKTLQQPSYSQGAYQLSITPRMTFSKAISVLLREPTCFGLCHAHVSFLAHRGTSL